jgi:hypothetical protein
MGQSLRSKPAPPPVVAVSEPWRAEYTCLVERLPDEPAFLVMSQYRVVCMLCGTDLNDVPCVPINDDAIIRRICCHCYACDRIKQLARYVVACRRLCRLYQMDADSCEYMVAYVKQLVWRLDEHWQSSHTNFTLWRILAYRLPHYWSRAFTIRRGNRMLCVDAHRWYTEYERGDTVSWTSRPRDDQFRATTVWMRLFTAIDRIIRDGHFCPISGGDFWCGDPHCPRLHICASPYQESAYPV